LKLPVGRQTDAALDIAQEAGRRCDGFSQQNALLTVDPRLRHIHPLNSDPQELNDAARAKYHARWEAVEIFKAQELVAMTEERAWQIIRSLRPFTQIP
jgi:hypothetical protein